MYLRMLQRWTLACQNIWSKKRRTEGYSRRRGQSWTGSEILESRALPAITFSVTFDDPGAAQAAFYADLEQNALAAAAELGQNLSGTASIEIVIGFSPTAPTANGGSEEYVAIRVEDGLTIVLPGTTSEVRTGVDPNGSTPDLRITIGIDYLTNDVWLDPTPFSGSDPVPADKVDGYSVLLHEIVHSFGFIGYGSDTDGSVTGGFATPFDDQVSFDGSNLYFNGPQAVAVYGGPVPLTFGNHFHVGNNLPRPGSELLTDLMNGVLGYLGVRDVISPLDFAILADTEVPLLAGSLPNTPPEIEPQTFSVLEQSSNGTVIGIVAATDPDVGQTRSFSILTGNAEGTFSIDAATGEITVANGDLLDFETQGTYTLSIKVTDNGSPNLSDMADVTINLIERSVPQIATSAGTTTIGKGTLVIIDPSAELESGPGGIAPSGTKLKATLAAGAGATDKFAVAATGDKSSRLKLKKGVLKKGKTAIGTVIGGTGGTPFEITFLPAASAADVETVLKKLSLKVSRRNVGTRTVAFQFFLADGSTGTPATKEVLIA